MTREELEYIVHADDKQLKQLERTLRQVNKAIGQDTPRSNQQAAKSFELLGQRSRRALGFVTLGVAGVTAGVAAMVAKTGFQFNAFRQQAEISFTTLLKSGTKAKAFLAELREFAIKTPFELPDLVTGSQRLLAMGFSAKQVLPALRSIGDAVAGLGGDPTVLDQVIKAMGQMKARGVAAAEEMNQLAQAGIASWRFLAKELGTTVQEAMKAVEKRSVDSGTAIRAVLSGINSEMGGLMAKQSQTWNGLMSTLKDLFRDLSGSVMQPFFKEASKGLKQLTDYLQEPAVQRRIQELSAEVGARLVPALKAAFEMGKNAWPSIRNGAKSVYEAAKDIAPVIKAIVIQADRFAKAIGGWGEVAKLVIAGVVAKKLLDLMSIIGVSGGRGGRRGRGGTGLIGAVGVLGTAFSVGLPAAVAVGVGLAITHLDELKGYTITIGDFILKTLDKAFAGGGATDPGSGANETIYGSWDEWRKKHTAKMRAAYPSQRAYGGGLTGSASIFGADIGVDLSQLPRGMMDMEAGSEWEKQQRRQWKAKQRAAAARARKQREQLLANIGNTPTMEELFPSEIAGDVDASGKKKKGSTKSGPKPPDIVLAAMKYLGIPYTWGGNNPEQGFDCSGFIVWLFKQQGIDIGARTTQQQVKLGQAVSPGKMRAGDVAFWDWGGAPGPEHTGMYIGGGRYVMASGKRGESRGNRGGRVKVVSAATYAKPSDIRRFATFSPSSGEIIGSDEPGGIYLPELADYQDVFGEMTRFRSLSKQAGNLQKLGLIGKGAAGHLKAARRGLVADALISPAELDLIKARLDKVSEIVAKGMEKARRKLEVAKGKQQAALGGARGKSMTAFDAETARLLAGVSIAVSAGDASFMFGAGSKTPAELALAAHLKSTREKSAAEKQLEAMLRDDELQARRDLESSALGDVSAAREALADEQRGGQDPARLAALQTAVEQTEKALARTRRDISIAELQEQVAAEQQTWEEKFEAERTRLEELGEIQRTAAETALERERKELGARRDLEREHFEAAIDALETSLANGRTTVAQGQLEYLALLQSFGVDYEEAGADLGTAFVTGLEAKLAEVGLTTAAVRAAQNESKVAVGGHATPISWKPAIEAMAEGGSRWVTSPTLFLAGEKGPELAEFTPASKLGSRARGARGGMFDGATFVVSDLTDAEVLAGRLADKLAGLPL